MDYSSYNYCNKITQMIMSAFVFLLLFISSSVICSLNFTNNNAEQLDYVAAYLKKINKPAVKTIQSRDGDLIDCVLSHLQPAFDHPLLKGQKPILEPPEMPEGQTAGIFEDFQVWRMYGESCPKNTIPIRRTTEEDVLRATSVPTFGRKLAVRRDSEGSDHEHVMAYANGSTYFGATAIINVWSPQVETENEFSLSQIWLLAGAFGVDLNTVEAGWQVDPLLYNGSYPRLFVYWTNDDYKSTGCYNLVCPGFVQISDKIVVGGAIRPVSTYNNQQFDIPISVWKKDNNWWLKVNEVSVGYWPCALFTHLNDGAANMVQFGGEIVNTESSGSHTSTQMGSGHFAAEGFNKTSYFRNLQVVDSNNNLISISSDIKVLAEKLNCYDINLTRTKGLWGDYFFYGGPGRNEKCT